MLFSKSNLTFSIIPEALITLLTEVSRAICAKSSKVNLGFTSSAKANIPDTLGIDQLKEVLP